LRPGGTAYLAAPERGGTLAAFLELAAPLFSVQQPVVEERYSAQVWAVHLQHQQQQQLQQQQQHQQLQQQQQQQQQLSQAETGYQPDIHFPKLVRFTKSL